MAEQARLKLGRRGIDVGARVIGTLLIAETAILALLVAGVLKEGGAGGLTAGTFTPDAVTSPGMLAILGFCFAAFMGFESTALYRGEARRPDRSIPRATYASVAFLGLFYCLVVWAIVQAFGDAQTILAVVVVVAFALAGADPYLQLLLLVNTPGCSPARRSAPTCSCWSWSRRFSRQAWPGLSGSRSRARRRTPGSAAKRCGR